MKTNLKIYLAACSVMAALGSCSQEVVVEKDTSCHDKECRTVSLQADLGKDSRIAFQEGETAINLLWEEKDAFSVLVGTAAQTPGTFTLTEGADTPNGKFTGELACNDGDKLYAIWPLMTDSMTTDNYFYWSLDGQKGVLDDQYTFMLGQGQYSAEGTNRMSFRYMTAALRMNLQLPAGVERIKQVRVQVDEHAGATVEISSGALIFDGSTNGGVTIDNEFEVKDGIAQVVAYFFAWDYSNLENGRVIVTDINDEQYVGMLGNGNIRPGKLYDVTVNMMGMVDFKNESVADGSEANPYEIATAEQFYSWMLRGNLDQTNEYGRNYRFCHYKLTNDIELNNEIVWYPFYLWDGGLDGQGHKISGNILMHNQYETGLFRLIENSVVQNLVLDFNVTFDNPNNHEEWFGMLTAEANNCQIINCVNYSDVTGNFWRMGGLVGRAGYGTSILACGNTGNLTTPNECRAMGGIVAHMEWNNLAVEGCYNTGNLQVSSPYWGDGLHIGGLVGWNTGENESAVKSSWSNALITVSSNQGNYSVYQGGIQGYVETGSITHCYWNEQVVSATGYQGEPVVISESTTFSGNLPTAEQFAIMNESLASKGWKFNAENGTVEKVTGVVAPSIPKEEW